MEKLTTAIAVALLLNCSTAMSQQREELLNYDFETTTQDWSARGGETIEQSEDAASNGTHCLKISNRQASWNGASLTSSKLASGKSYRIECDMMYFSEKYKSHKYQFGATYTINGEPEFVDIDMVSCKSGWWHTLFGTVSIPGNAADIAFYFQSEYKETDKESDMLDFYIDNVKVFIEPEDTNFSAEKLANLTSLKDYFANYFKIGTCVSANEITIDEAQKHILKHYNSITCENEMKPEYLLDQEASIKAGKVCVKIDETTKSIMKFCEENDIPMRGHTLVWHSQTPSWFFYEGFDYSGRVLKKKEMSVRMEQYIQAVFESISSTCPNLKLYAFDVVNEAFVNDGAAMNALRDSYESPWTSIFKDESFIDSAFTYARRYAPATCKLYYNDYNEYFDAKSYNIYTLVKRLHEKGLCDGVGMQSHLDVVIPTIAEYDLALERFSSISDSIDIQVTELDMTTSSLMTQAEQYGELFDVLVKYADHISSVTFWGTNDELSWRTENDPLVFSKSYIPKLAYYSIVHEDAPEVLVTPPAKEKRPEAKQNTVGKIILDINGKAVQQLTVYGKNGAIVIETANGAKTDACIYQIDGRMVGRYTIDGRAEISMPSGIYIVDKQKVVVM